VLVEFLAQADESQRIMAIQEIPQPANISAANLPHAAILKNHHTTRAITANLLQQGGSATEVIKHADIVSFTCLKAIAILQNRFTNDANGKGYLKDGPVSVAKFEIGREGDNEKRVLCQRMASYLIESFIHDVDAAVTEVTTD